MPSFPVMPSTGNADRPDSASTTLEPASGVRDSPSTSTTRTVTHMPAERCSVSSFVSPRARVTASSVGDASAPCVARSAYVPSASPEMRTEPASSVSARRDGQSTADVISTRAFGTFAPSGPTTVTTSAESFFTTTRTSVVPLGLRVSTVSNPMAETTTVYGPSERRVTWARPSASDRAPSGNGSCPCTSTSAPGTGAPASSTTTTSSA